jgi:hypothetical protein
MSVNSTGFHIVEVKATMDFHALVEALDTLYEDIVHVSPREFAPRQIAILRKVADGLEKCLQPAELRKGDKP